MTLTEERPWQSCKLNCFRDSTKICSAVYAGNDDEMILK